MSHLDTPTIERVSPGRARQISESTGRGEWIRTPVTAGATFALVVLAMLVLVVATVIGTVRP